MKSLLAAALVVVTALTLGCQPPDEAPTGAEDTGQNSPINSQADALEATGIAWHGTASAALDQTTGPGLTLSVAKPSKAVAGDVAFAAVSTYSWVQIPTPSGWTRIEDRTDTGSSVPSGIRTAVFWRVVDAADTAFSFGFSAKARGNAVVSVYSNVDTTSPVDDLSDVTASQASRTLTTPSVGTSRASEKLVAFFSAGNPLEPAGSTGSLYYKRGEISSGNAGSWGIQTATYQSRSLGAADSQPGESITFSSATDIALGTLIAMHVKESAPTCTVSSKLVPSCGAWFGLAEGPLVGESTAQALTRIETEIGRKLDIVHSYKGPGDIFPSSFEQQESDGGRFLLINWKPDLNWARAASGQDDAYLKQEAQAIKAYGQPLFLALFHEPENDMPGDGTPADYIAMWHHVRAVFDQQGVTNAVWVWNMMGWSGHADNYRSGADSVYPGDAYVDWIAYDPYNKGTGTKWASFASITNGTASGWPGFYTWAVTEHPDKPLMLAEYGTIQNPDDHSKETQWFLDAVDALKGPRSQIKAVVYFDTRYNGVPYMLATPEMVAGFTQMGADPFLNQAHP